MQEVRTCYNPFSKHYMSGMQSHTLQIYNKGKQKIFDEYIRGIILENVLYLRLYNPFNDADILSKNELYQSSYTLLNDNKKAILKAIRKNDNINIKDVKFNYSNDLFKELNLISI